MYSSKINVYDEWDKKVSWQKRSLTFDLSDTTPASVHYVCGRLPLINLYCMYLGVPVWNSQLQELSFIPSKPDWFVAKRVAGLKFILCTWHVVSHNLKMYPSACTSHRPWTKFRILKIERENLQCSFLGLGASFILVKKRKWYMGNFSRYCVFSIFPYITPLSSTLLVS